MTMRRSRVRCVGDRAAPSAIRDLRTRWVRRSPMERTVPSSSGPVWSTRRDYAGIGVSASGDDILRRPRIRYATAPGGIPATRRHIATGPRTASGGRRRRSRCARKISRAATIHPIAIWIGGGRRSASLEGLTTSGPQLTRRHDRRSRSMRALRRRRRPLQSRPLQSEPLRSRLLRRRGPAPAPGGPSSS